MNREEFLARLEGLLRDIPQEERREALQYYRDYFEDAGPEHEQEIIQELGSPEKVAATIKADLGGNAGENGTYTETGYQDGRFSEKETPEASRTYSYAEKPERGKNRFLKGCLIVVILLFAVPTVLPACAGLFAMLIGIVCAILGLFIGLVAGSAAIFIAGIALVIAGILQLWHMAPAGLFTIGTGLILAALGLAACVGTVKLCMMVYPPMFRWFIDLCRRPLHRKEAAGS